MFISKEKHNTLKNGTLERKDIVLNTRGTLGNVALYEESVPYSVMRINSGMIIMRVKNRKFNLKYLSNYIISPHFKDQIKERKTGTAQPQLPSNILRSFIINIPSEDEQNMIVQELETRFSLTENIENSINIGLKKTDVFKHAILKKAFEGKLVPQNSTDKSATQLLKQIQIEKEAYLKAQKETIKLKHRKKRTMVNKKTVFEILKESDKPILAKELWQSSVHKYDIDAFYAQIKELIEKGEIEEIERRGKESYLKLAETK